MYTYCPLHPVHRIAPFSCYACMSISLHLSLTTSGLSSDACSEVADGHGLLILMGGQPSPKADVSDHWGALSFLIRQCGNRLASSSVCHLEIR
nr:hypothetical protein CFP56_03276 [Quercus suber]